MHTRLLVSMLMASTVGAATFSTLPGALKQILPSGQKAFKTKFVATTAQANALNAFGDGDFREGDAYDVYYSKDPDGKITSMAIQLEEYQPKWKSRHNWVIGLGNDGKLSGIGIVELTDKYSYPLAQPEWLKRFSGKPAAQMAFGNGVDAISGASASSQLLIESIHRAAYIASQVKLP
ncbi:MAG: FMN-binding protein [Fibrobacteres bacterium]|nr:FMN-binding protein [Fibrobacterota bacterium]